MVSGIAGGIPCTGVLVRTAVNIASGADHKYSQLINAFWVLMIVVVLIPLFVYIPMCIIASILVTSAFRLIPISIMKQMWHNDKAEFLILWITMLICIFIDGAMGLMAGSFISLLRHAVNTGEAELEITDNQDGSGELKITPDGPINFINTIDFGIKTVDAVKSTKMKVIVIDLKTVTHIDCDGLENLEKIVSSAPKDAKVVFIGQETDSKVWANSMLKKNSIVVSSYT